MIEPAARQPEQTPAGGSRRRVPLVVLTLDDQRYALHLSAVERVVRMVEITPLPKAPDIVSGVVNVQGRVAPVFNIRKRFRLSERDLAVTDQLVIARTATRLVALISDAATGVVECAPEDIAAAESIVPGMEFVEGVLKLKDGMVLIHDLDTFLSLEEEQALDQAMGGQWQT